MVVSTALTDDEFDFEWDTVDRSMESVSPVMLFELSMRSRFE
jgi:hypothetical protein